MPELHNLTEVQKTMIGIAYSDGQKMGKKIADAIESGELQLPDGKFQKKFYVSITKNKKENFNNKYFIL